MFRDQNRRTLSEMRAVCGPQCHPKLPGVTNTRFNWLGFRALCMLSIFDIE